MTSNDESNSESESESSGSSSSSSSSGSGDDSSNSSSSSSSSGSDSGSESGSNSSSSGSESGSSDSSDENEEESSDDDEDAISVVSSASGGSDEHNAAYTARLRHSHVVIDKNLKRDTINVGSINQSYNYESSSSTASHADSSENLFTSLSRHPNNLSKISLNLASSAGRLAEPKLSKALAPDTRPIPRAAFGGSFAKDRKDASVHVKLPLVKNSTSSSSAKKIEPKREFGLTLYCLKILKLFCLK